MKNLRRIFMLLIVAVIFFTFFLPVFSGEDKNDNFYIGDIPEREIEKEILIFKVSEKKAKKEVLIFDIPDRPKQEKPASEKLKNVQKLSFKMADNSDSENEDFFRSAENFGEVNITYGKLKKGVKREKKKNLQTDIKGKIEVFGATFRGSKSEKNKNYAEVRFFPVLNIDYGDYDAYIEGDLRMDSVNKAHGVVDDFDEERHPWSMGLKEAYVEHYGSLMHIRLGKQILDWSTMEIASKSDFSPKDYTDITRIERMGIWGAFAKIYTTDNSYLDLFYSPRFALSRMPMPESRFFQDPPHNLQVVESDMDKNHSLFAARFGMYNFLDSDLTFSYFRGYNSNPYYEPKIQNGFPVISTQYVHKEAYTMSVAKDLAGGIIGRAEISYIEQDGAEDYLQYMLNFDKQWFGVFTPTDKMFTLLQYTTSNKEMGGYNIDRIFDNTIMGKIEYDLKKTTTKLEAIYDLDGDGSYLKPSLEMVLGDNTILETGIDLINGSEKFIAPKNEARCYLKFSYMF